MTALPYTINCIGKTADFFLRELPQALKATGVEALLIDQVSPGAETVADFLGIPFITICSAVVVNKEETVPPFVTTWGYSTALWSILRNRAAYSFGSSKYVVIEYLLPQSIVVMMDKIPNSTNMVF
jgi:hypothetical protein